MIFNNPPEKVRLAARELVRHRRANVVLDVDTIADLYERYGIETDGEVKMMHTEMVGLQRQELARKYANTPVLLRVSERVRFEVRVAAAILGVPLKTK